MKADHLTAPTCLYHPTLAPAGKVFEATEGNPIPHPGEGWVDTPAGFDTGAGEQTSSGSSDALTEANRALAEALDENERLTAENADLKAQIAKFDKDGDGKAGGSKPKSGDA